VPPRTAHPVVRVRDAEAEFPAVSVTVTTISYCFLFLSWAVVSPIEAEWPDTWIVVL